MASPFAIFRKNQKAMYALLAILCMVGFSIGGAIDYSDRMRSTADPVVATAYGKSIHASEVHQLLRRRRLTIGFLAECKAAEFNLPGIAQFFAPQFESTLGPATEEAVVETWVLDERARQMGLIVSDDAVNKFLKELTQDKVKPEVFRDIAKQLGIGQPQLFDALRAELMALRLREMALGRPQTTPAQRWDYYRRQKQRATVEVAAVPVEDFIG
ncbi:MAG: SurA N-terminal domain-containing protein [Pirellulales bacterium]